MDVGTAIEKFGVTTTLIIIIVIALDKRVWPFIVAQIEAWQADRKAERECITADRIRERDAFIANLTALQATANAAHMARAERDRAIAEQIEAMATAVRQVAVLVQHNYDALHLITPRVPRRKAHPIN
jgi:hypothetical protein